MKQRMQTDVRGAFHNASPQPTRLGLATTAGSLRVRSWPGHAAVGGGVREVTAGLDCGRRRRGLTPPLVGGGVGRGFRGFDVGALFLTWTTYGTWLPGDERGHVSNTLHRDGGFDPKQNRPGTPYAADDAYTRERAKQLQKWESVWLSASQALVVAQSLAGVSVQRGWMMLRASVMSNHVHALVIRCPLEGAAVRRVLKGNCQAALSEAAGQSHRWWTAGGSDRKRSGDESIAATTRYIADQPGKLAEVIENVALAAATGEDLRG
jgi:REP element-mobilizing transposase RayT